MAKAREGPVAHSCGANGTPGRPRLDELRAEARLIVQRWAECSSEIPDDEEPPLFVSPPDWARDVQAGFYVLSVRATTVRRARAT